MSCKNDPKKFINNAFHGAYRGETATCPCTRCCMAYLTKTEVQKHLLVRGFDESFINARGDGEPSADEKDCN